MSRKVAVLAMPLLLVWLVMGCNLFSFTNPVDSAADYVSEGREHLRDGKYADAIESFTNALDENPNDAYARWGRAKAYLRSTIETADVTSIGLIAQMSQFQSGLIPFQDDPSTASVNEWPAERADAVYQAMFMVLEDLGAIVEGSASNAELGPADVRIDYLSAFAVHACLTLRDTNVDSVIDSNDFDLSFLMDLAGQVDLDASAWNNLTASQQQDLINAATNLLTNSSTQVIGLLGDMGIDVTDMATAEELENLGLDISSLDDFNNNLENGLQGLLGP